MELTINDTLSLWKTEGQELIQQNYQVFRRLLTTAKDLAERGNYDAAVVYGQMAASYAQSNHCGLFVSSELEGLLLAIGRQTISSDLDPLKPRLLSGNPQKILHVSTITSAYGGISKLMRRWIAQDRDRSHSVALTGHAPTEIPQILRDTVANSQGRIHLINERPGGIIARAKRLRKLAAEADIVVLHSWEHDVIPTIAFANDRGRPPIIYTNHGDHWLWVGAGISDAVANLRESGMRLSQHRRGIEAKRNLLLPTILEPSKRTLSRSEAKQQLCLDEDSVLLLSIARGVKYKSIDGMSFADAHVLLLQQNPQAHLITIGPGDLEDWSVAIEQTQGRIRVLGETPDTAVFYQAADIYVDSYPFVSITSLLEAGSYGVPSVSRCPYATDACEIIGADMPGLTGNSIRVWDLQEYTAVLSRLINNEGERLALGEKTQSKIAATHWGDNWQNSLNDLYLQAIALSQSPVSLTANPTDEMFLGEPDVFLARIHKTAIDRVLRWHLTLLPFWERLHLWLELVKQYGLQNTPINLLMPEWIRARYHLLRSR